MWKWLIILCCVTGPCLAQTVVAERTVRAQHIITAADVTLSDSTLAQGFARLSDVVGQEARIALYPGRPILAEHIGPPALITRNQIVKVSFAAHGLLISTEGRALERGAEGDRIRFMNLSSRATVIGIIQSDGSLQVVR